MSGLELESALPPDDLARRIDTRSLPFFTLARDGTVALRLGHRFVAWRVHSEAEQRLLPRPALWARIEPCERDGVRSRVRGLHAGPAPDVLLVVPFVLFATWVLTVFGAAGAAGVLVVSLGWWVPARLIAGGLLDGDAPELELWLRAALRPVDLSDRQGLRGRGRPPHDGPAG